MGRVGVEDADILTTTEAAEVFGCRPTETWRFIAYIGGSRPDGGKWGVDRKVFERAARFAFLCAGLEAASKALRETFSFSPTPIYFIQSGDVGPIKIGVSASPEMRLASMQTGNPETLHLRLTVKHALHGERAYHRLFREFRIRGEWFQPSSDLLLFIDGSTRWPRLSLPSSVSARMRIGAAA